MYYLISFIKSSNCQLWTYEIEQPVLNRKHFQQRPWNKTIPTANTQRNSRKNAKFGFFLLVPVGRVTRISLKYKRGHVNYNCEFCIKLNLNLEETLSLSEIIGPEVRNISSQTKWGVKKIRGLAHLARALAWQARGDRFESDILHY